MHYSIYMYAVVCVLLLFNIISLTIKPLSLLKQYMFANY